MVSGLADYQDSESGSHDEALSARQREILDLLTQGKANKEIAYELGIGIGTVKQHLVALYKKMGVTNRAMAVSKGISTAGRIHPINDSEPGNDLYLERRSAVVLSLQVRPDDGLIEEEDAFIARRIMSQNAMDFDALFLANPDARGDVIFGLERTRRYDCLRAVRLAISVARDIESKLGPSFKVRAGMSCGYVLKGIGDDASWTGEVIAIDVISDARQHMPKSSQSSLGMSASALMATRSLGMCAGEDGGKTLPLDTLFRWSYCKDGHDTSLFGRDAELIELSDAYDALEQGEAQTFCIESGAGMGRTALVRAYADQLVAKKIAVYFFKALLPNSRPSGKSRGLIDAMDTVKKPVTTKVFLDNLSKLKKCVVIVEDCHALSQVDFETLATPNAKLAAAGVQLVLTYRGRLSEKIKTMSGMYIIRLGRLDKKSARALTIHRASAAKRLQKWVIEKSNGVPGFIASLCAAGNGLSDKADLDRLPVPYDLFSMIEERIDALGVSRNLLFVLANDDRQADVTMDQDEIARAVKAGFLKKNTESSDKKVTYIHANPTVAWVMAHSFVRRNTVFAR